MFRDNERSLARAGPFRIRLPKNTIILVVYNIEIISIRLAKIICAWLEHHPDNGKDP